MGKQKRLGILTSGGDCPGLNTVIRAVVSHATLTYNWEVLGIPYATQGLLQRRTMVLNVHGLDLHGIDPLLSTGGTILGAMNKGDTLAQAEEIISGYQELGLDALIAVGGDGSLSLLHQLAQRGSWKLVAVPKTIDNDVALTTLSVGFDTAINTIADALYRLTFTAASHDRVMVVEVMGREAGHLALHSGIVGGADVILIPEIPYSIDQVCHKISELRDKWKRKFAIVVVAEGAKTLNGESRYYTDSCGQVRLRGIGEYIADQITNFVGSEVEVRVTVLGHVQRGGLPSALDRFMATVFGKAAVDLIAQENYSQMVAWQNGQVVSVPLNEVIAKSPVSVDPKGFVVQTARSLGIYLGNLKPDEQSTAILTCAESQQ
ncbi:ATP-dependent 6-phosphofructokinase [Lyngbya aestuarii]|uniref:ATP-dependent 6-phosphofructokinase n=1 Tax=Lyngbya aestuarii TaxID=118322 RepID=UPI00403E15E0